MRGEGIAAFGADAHKKIKSEPESRVMMQIQGLDGNKGESPMGWGTAFKGDRNFPCQTLKIRKVSLVVMGS
jgi:hypothetical protein